MGNWQEAANAAAIARQGYPLNSNEYTSGFDNVDATEWLGHAPALTKPIISVAPHAFTDNINDGYGLAFWNKDFVSLFSSSDVRNTFFDLYKKWVTAMSICQSLLKIYFRFQFRHSNHRSPEMMLIEIEANLIGKVKPAVCCCLYSSKTEILMQ